MMCLQKKPNIIALKGKIWIARAGDQKTQLKGADNLPIDTD
jgi:hypothetical protein